MYRPKALEEVNLDAEKIAEHKYYWCLVRCANCGLRKSLAFFKGDNISTHCCPTCETTNLIKE